MKMLRIHLEDALERTSLALLSGGCPQSSSPASAGMSAQTDDKIKCYLSSSSQGRHQHPPLPREIRQ